MDFPAIWKVISIILGGVFGILGMMTDFRDKETKKVTLWGRIALGGIIVTTAFGLVAQLKEHSADAAKAIASEEQQKRLLLPLGHPQLEVGMRFDCKNEKDCKTLEEERENLHLRASLAIYLTKDDVNSFDRREQADLYLGISEDAPKGAVKLDIFPSTVPHHDFINATIPSPDISNLSDIMSARDILPKPCVVSAHFIHQPPKEDYIDALPSIAVIQLTNGIRMSCDDLKPWVGGNGMYAGVIKQDEKRF